MPTSARTLDEHRQRPGAGDTSDPKRLEYFDGAWSNIVAKDLGPQRLRDVPKFKKTFYELARHPGRVFVPHKVAVDVQAKPDTVVAWKGTLEDLHLVQQLPPLKPNLRPDRGHDKAYVTDPGWISYAHHVADHTRLLGDPRIGGHVETVLVDHARRLQYNLLHTTSGGIGYVKDPEVDIAVDLGTRWLLLEAKYATTPRGHLHHVGDERSLRVIATRDTFALTEPEGVQNVPAHEWALLC